MSGNHTEPSAPGGDFVEASDAPAGGAGTDTTDSGRTTDDTDAQDDAAAGDLPGSTFGERLAGDPMEETTAWQDAAASDASVPGGSAPGETEDPGESDLTPAFRPPT